jgi:hypothetical protein
MTSPARQSKNAKFYSRARNDRREPIVAWQVDGDEYGDIVFARTADEAAEKAEVCGPDSVLRTPKWDHLAPGPVPAQDLIADNWWFECSNCAARVDADMTDTRNFDAEGNDLEADDIGPYFVGARHVFCNQLCFAESCRDETVRMTHEAALVDLVVTKYPEVITVDHAYWDESKPERSQVSFFLPGMQGSVKWTVGEDTVWVENRDKEVFQARYSASQHTAPIPQAA